MEALWAKAKIGEAIEDFTDDECVCATCVFFDMGCSGIEYPCKACKGTVEDDREEEKKRPLLWEPIVQEDVAKEAVNHPKHYNREGAMECIDEMVQVFGAKNVMHFCMMNVWKYRYRAGMKGSGEEDMRKSDWYMRKATELKELRDGKKKRE